MENTATVNILELASELADKKLFETFEGQKHVEQENGDINYTEKAQDRFNEYYDEFYTLIERYGL